MSLAAEKVAHYRQTIEDRLASIAAQLEESADTAEVVDLDLPIGRLTRSDAMQQQQVAIHLRQRLNQERVRLSAALDRIAAGRFGVCPMCGDAIPEARLAAMPEAPLCTTCETARAKR